MLIELISKSIGIGTVLKFIFVCLFGFLLPQVTLVFINKIISRYIDPFEEDSNVTQYQAKLYESKMSKKERNEILIFTTIGIIIPCLISSLFISHLSGEYSLLSIAKIFFI